MSTTQPQTQGVVELNAHRRVSHDRTFSYIFLHNQSNTGGDVHPTFKIPLGQAADANAICLANKHDVLVTSIPVSEHYLDYFSTTLGLTVPQIYTPKIFNTDLLQSIVDCKEDFVKWIKEKQAGGPVREKLVLSVFEAEDRDIALLDTLQAAGLGDNLTSECNYDCLPLGNKDGFREFCTTNKITQLPGGTFTTVEDVERFVITQHEKGHTVVIKAPHGIGGGGQIRLRPPLASEIKDIKQGAVRTEWQATVREWIKKEKAVAAEMFADAAESEHVIDVYIDPDYEHHSSVMFDQLVRNDDESAGMAYYGAKYPSASEDARKRIMDEVEQTVVPAFLKARYRGPAGIDVLWKPLHFMELNMRTDAITYVKHLTDRIGKNLYDSDPGTTGFMSLVNLQLTSDASVDFADLLKKHKDDALAKKEDGIFALSQPNRQRWGFYDVVAVSPHGREQAEKVLIRALTQICGEEKAQGFLKVIYKPHPQFIPEQPKAQQ